MSRKNALSHKKSALPVIRQFGSETGAIREAPTPKGAQTTLYALTSLIIVSMIVLCVARLDRVVASTKGTIVTKDDLLKVVQVLDPSLIKSIDVREGDRVERGQQLVTLDQTFAAADVEQLRLQIASLAAQIARDEAELANKPLDFAPASDPDFLRYQALQKEYYSQHVAQFAAQMRSFDAKIQQFQATIQKLEGDQGRWSERGDIAAKIESMKTELEKKGAGSLLNLLQSQDARIEVVRQMENTSNSLVEAKQGLASARADREAFKQQWSSALSQELVTARGQLDTAKAQYEKAAKHQDLVRLSASEPSVVLSLAKVSVGSVLNPGATLLTLMPLNTTLEAEIHIAPRDIGFVRVGDRCRLKIDAFDYSEHGEAAGKVRWISEGTFNVDASADATDAGRTTDPFYKARCTIDEMHFVGVPDNFRLVPGMTLQAGLKVGSRSAMMYMLGGLMRGIGESMREP